MRSLYSVFGVMIAVLVLASCRDTTIDPFDNQDRLLTIYGFLNPLDSLQTIRVIPITRRNEEIDGASESQNTLAAEVISIDLTASTFHEWRHSLKQLEDGSWGHFFTGNIKIFAGHTYRLVISRKDGSSIVAETTVPINGLLLALERSDPYIHPSLGVVQDITIPGGRQLWDYHTVYYLKNGTASGRIVVPQEQSEPLTGPGPWTVTLPLSQDQAVVAQIIAGSELVGIESNARLIGMGMLFRVVDNNWNSYLNQTDDQLLDRTDVQSNVTRGAGFWGSMGLLIHEWNVPPELSQALGYQE